MPAPFFASAPKQFRTITPTHAPVSFKKQWTIVLSFNRLSGTTLLVDYRIGPLENSIQPLFHGRFILRDDSSRSQTHRRIEEGPLRQDTSSVRFMSGPRGIAATNVKTSLIILSGLSYWTYDSRSGAAAACSMWITQRRSGISYWFLVDYRIILHSPPTE